MNSLGGVAGPVHLQAFAAQGGHDLLADLRGADLLVEGAVRQPQGPALSGPFDVLPVIEDESASRLPFADLIANLVVPA